MKCTAVFVAALTALSASARGDVLAAKGAKGTLEVEYVFESSGKKADQNDSREWRVKRTLKLNADMVAQAPQPYSTLHDMTAGEKTDLKKKQAATQSAQQKMAPTSAAIEKIMAKCGEDEACISREVQALGFSMQGDPADRVGEEGRRRRHQAGRGDLPDLAADPAEGHVHDRRVRPQRPRRPHLPQPALHHRRNAQGQRRSRAAAGRQARGSRRAFRRSKSTPPARR